MTEIAPISQQIWDMKYRLKDAEGRPLDKALSDTWRRVAKTLAAAESDPSAWEDRFFDALRISSSCRRAASCPAPGPTAA